MRSILQKSQAMHVETENMTYLPKATASQSKSTSSAHGAKSLCKKNTWFTWEPIGKECDERLEQSSLMPLDYRQDWSLETEKIFEEFLQVDPGYDLNQVLHIDNDSDDRNFENDARE